MRIFLRSAIKGQIQVKSLKSSSTLSELYETASSLFQVRISKLFKDIHYTRPVLSSTDPSVTLSSLKIFDGDTLFVEFEKENVNSNVIDLTSDEGKQEINEERLLQINLLTYNVWFEEGIAVKERMKAIADIVVDNRVHCVCFQECTPLIMALLKIYLPTYVFIPQNSFHGFEDLAYFTCIAYSSIGGIIVKPLESNFHSFLNSKMGRGLQTCVLSIENNFDNTLASVLIGTTHLESPVKGSKFFTERKQQFSYSLNCLEVKARAQQLTFFMGDFNWITSTVKSNNMTVNSNWEDVWTCTKKDITGYTYDQKSNGMLLGNQYQSRLDRVFFYNPNLLNSTIPDKIKISIVGNSAIKGVMHTYSNSMTKPVYPSDHFGLLVSFRP